MEKTITGTGEWLQLDEQYYLPVFKRYPIVLERGEGARVWDTDGKQYLDALAGIAVTSLGHNHPEVVATIREQAGRLMHVSNFFLTKPQAQLSKMLFELSGLERSFFTNSGAEAVEGAVKIARKYAHSKGRGGTIISTEGCFHGRTLATIATGKAAMQKGFEPIPQGFQQIPFNDMEAVENAATDDTAAIIIEPVQGEGGIHIAQKDFLQNLRAFCDEKDIVLIFDEIQCGIGRTGKMFAKEHSRVQPDITTLAKALGNGMPIGAVLCNEKVAAALDFGDHGTTFGGNPLACAAALATLRLIDDTGFLEGVEEKGRWLREIIEAANPPGLKEVRGLGLMIGIEFGFDTKPLALKMLEHGVIANSTAGNVLRLLPPLIISKEQLQKVVDVLAQSVKEVNPNG